MAEKSSFPSRPEQEAILDEVTARIRDMTIGLMNLSEAPGQEDAQPVGTGTLVSIDDTFGLLTAAHVIAALPRQGPIGFVRFTNKPN